MASIPPFRQIQFDQIPGAPAWFANFLGSLNTFIASVYDTVNNNTTFGDNIPSQLKTVSVQVDSDSKFSPISFASTLQAAPKACFLGQVQLTSGTAGTSAISLNQWTYVAGKIQIDSLVGMQAACTYTLTFLVI